MRYQDLLLAASLTGLVVLLLAGCSGDCAWNADFRTWIDENENGVWDADELPLPGVKIFVEGSVTVPEVISDEKGVAHLQEITGGCPREAVFFVGALPPPGYLPSIRTLYPGEERFERVFEFGFIAVDE